MSKVTVAIPTYNREDYLPEVLKSLEGQTFKDFEVIIFDDNSNYDVSTLALRFAKLNIKVEKSEASLGNVGNFNRIMQYPFATPYVIIFHDDDVMHPLLLEHEVKALDIYKDAVFVGTRLQFCPPGTDMFSFPQIVKMQIREIKSSLEFMRILLKGFELCFSSVMYRMEKVHHDPSFNKPFYTWHDRPFLLEQTKYGSCVLIDAPLVQYRLHQAQVSQEGVKWEYLDSIKRMFVHAKSFLPEDMNKQDMQLFWGWTTYGVISFLLQKRLPIPELVRRLKDPFIRMKYLSVKQWILLGRMLLLTRLARKVGS